MPSDDLTPIVLGEMAKYGLHPGDIIWDGKKHRFGDNGVKDKKTHSWFIAHPDPPANITFRSFKLGIEKTTHVFNGINDEFDPEKWAEIQREREQKEQEERDKVAEECRERWEEADVADPTHPYLRRKQIKMPWGLKQEGKDLLVPMKSTEDTRIVNLQSIKPDGEKRFQKGGRFKDTYMTLGGPSFQKETDTIYIVEGYATGWTVFTVSKCATIVCFAVGNLMGVAKAMREKRPKANIVIASDNDRWTTLILNGEKQANPGYTVAREVAEAIKGRVAVPDFQAEALVDKPTDFNDLHMLEGPDAVKVWLNPDRAVDACVLDPALGEELAEEEDRAEAEEQEQELAVEEDQAVPTWADKAPFRCLGYSRDHYFFMPREKGQVVRLASSQHTKLGFLTMAPLAWWERAFPAKGNRDKADWSAAADALFRASHQRGVFNENVRGRGCWNVEDEVGEAGLLLHLGDKLLPPGATEFVDPEAYECPEGVVYERAKRLAGPSKANGLDLDGARKVLRLFQNLLWHEEASGLLLAGWTVLAPLGGALPWRPHVWLTGGSGSGKSTVLSRLIDPLLGDMRFFFDANSTEAGMRQTLNWDSLPVLFDEAADKKGGQGASLVQHIIELIRSASSTSLNAVTAKGTPSGQALNWHIRSMFCLASVTGALETEADKTRITLLQMRSRASMKRGEKNAHWKDYEPQLREVNQQMGRELIARSLAWFRDGRFEATLKYFVPAASHLLGDPRYGQQYGTLSSGAWMLMSDEPPGDEMEAREVLGGTGLEPYTEEQCPEGLRALQILLQKEVRVDSDNGVKTAALGQLLGIAAGEPGGPVSYDEAIAKLKQVGLRVEGVGPERKLFLANGSEWVKQALHDTPYAHDFKSVLRTLPGVSAGGQVRFHTGLTSRTTSVPWKLIDGLDNGT